MYFSYFVIVITCLEKFSLAGGKQATQPILANGYLMTYMKQLLANEHVNNSCNRKCHNCDSKYSRSCYDNRRKYIPASCAEALTGNSRDGLYLLDLPSSGLKPFYVYCMRDKKGKSAWTVFQRRIDGSIDFYKNWNEYKYGFGNLNGEFFLGLQYLNALTHSQPHELCIHMEDFRNTKNYACYRNFRIGNETTNYHLQFLGAFDGNTGDEFKFHQGSAFSTKDKDNDSDSNNNCAKTFTGAWWFKNCHESHLNGEYLRETKKNEGTGIVWKNFTTNSYNLLKYVDMAIRPLK